MRGWSDASSFSFAETSARLGLAEGVDCSDEGLRTPPKRGWPRGALANPPQTHSGACPLIVLCKVRASSARWGTTAVFGASLRRLLIAANARTSIFSYSANGDPRFGGDDTVGGGGGVGARKMGSVEGTLAVTASVFPAQAG
jgi:hypothetical protein